MEQSQERPWYQNYPQEVAPALQVPSLSVADLLLQAAAKYPSHEALYFLGKKTTYRELLASAQRMAGGLQTAGIQKGDRVAIMLPNCPQLVIAYFGILLMGGTVVMTNPLYVERELEHQLRDSGASAIVMLDLFYSRLAKVRGEAPEKGPLPFLKHIIVTSVQDALPFPKNLLYPIKQHRAGHNPTIPYGRDGIKRFQTFLAKAPAKPAEVMIASEQDVAVLQYTGGTTGLPKGVMLTHRNLVANSVQMAAWCYRMKDGSERFLAALPLFHVFGLTVLMNQSVMRAGTLILLPRFEAAAVLQTIRKQKPTFFPGAPTMYIALLNHPDVNNYDLSSINICISGSAPLPLEVQKKFEALTGGRLIEGYGLTEAAPVTHVNPIWGKRKVGSIGLPVSETEIRIVDLETAELLPAGQVGELLIRGPQVMAGYWNRAEETAAVLQDGWLHTGDLAAMDSDGFFTIVDRIKDLIIAGGYNIYPREIEEVLYEHPGVRDASIIGVQDPYRGETVKAFIVLRKGWQVSSTQLDVWCRARLAAYKVPHLYEFRSELPMSMMGKILRRKLHEEEAAKEKQLNPVEPEEEQADQKQADQEEEQP
ncbi:long-chain-fatty-acid--CoA ligase [Paenibacillus baekrokdamisoli]|uniref:Long-chain-fatty-acid--CoA ligase n=1 Tax=Paenibacillus baekrokdamisoli TaxID=1712516 RepID=A0A3G9JI90_9BACL|nr:long-chain fatty acid--CoA ligase [Paenibacillus baekrokdamisoli]MBB3068218.1 long-chain acyl-CoA synthetase [Paenibacillus baekrokdamisoli]BBH22739.1 long-chain-fatty-acid--CoA ligase [Paenibacillus baekrokdamisoli]